MSQPRLVKQRRNALAQLLQRVVKVRRRQLLGPDFQQEILKLGRRPFGHRSQRNLRRFSAAQRMAQLLAPLDPQRRDLARQIAHAGEIARALGDADGAPAVQHVERMRRLQHVIVSRDRQAPLRHRQRLAFVQIEQLRDALHSGRVQIIDAHLVFVLAEKLAVFKRRIVTDFLEMIRALQRHQDALQAIGDLHRHRIDGKSPGLLEIRELGDFQAIEPDLPAQAPGPQSRRFPVVLHETDIVLRAVDAQRLEAGQIQFLRIARIGLEDHLVLRMHLHAIGIVAIARIVGANARLHIADIPRLRPQNAQIGRRIHRPRANLGIVRLPKQASGFGPETLKAQYGVLKRQRLAHEKKTSRIGETKMAISEPSRQMSRLWVNSAPIWMPPAKSREANRNDSRVSRS
ncbi:MAG: hypothetical protein BWZ10_02016 [candidate division BRC1 bacterium ADurb.BinA364]|nr:MAG: hypothetical protein BWZ10_02016 [candidate division BRC1 bacterium ADurb.BinA364]